MQKNAARRRKRGFTLQEMLLVILLFAILAGLAIPGVIALQRSLHMKKLDEYARQIYIAAQNELTEMKASGRLELFAQELNRQNGRLPTRPSDYPADDDDSWKDLFYVSSDSTTGQNYLLRADDSLRQATEQGGSFIVELNPLSGDVYSAFYAEESFDYATVCSITEYDRDKSTRQKATPQLGYYSSSTAEYGTVGMPSRFEPKINVVNGEELALNVSCDHLMALRRTQRYLTLTVTITDEHQQSENLTFHGGTDFFVVNDSITVTKILDSLEEKNQFAKVLPRLTAGDDLTITAKMTYEDTNNNINIMGETTVENVSSLFANKTTADGATTINVDHVRHLNNLRSSIYGTDTAAQVVQTGNISFLFDDWKSGTDYVSAWTKNPMDRFPAIENDKLFDSGSYDGKLNTIAGFNFTAEGTETYAALFGALDNTTLNGVRLVDCAATGDTAATLAGRLTGCTVTDCGAYLTTKDGMGASYDMAARREQYRVNGQNAAGGLIAVAENTKISTSFGAVDVKGGANNGGLVGQMTGGSVEQSYGSGNITATGANNGGLVGQMSGSTISSCYATGKVQAPSSSGGLIGSSSGGAVKDCNSYGRVTTDGDSENGANCGGFVGVHSNTNFSDCAFLQQASYNSNYGTVSGVTASAYTTMRKDVTEAEQIGLSTPYLTGLQGHGFPFPLCKNGEDQMMHYGDWPEAYQLQTSLVYYEKYADGTYGYYAKTCLISGGESAGDNWVVDTLRNEYCVEDGYALMTSYVLEAFNYTLDTAALSGKSVYTGSVNIVTDEKDVTTKNSLCLLDNAELKFENKDGAGGQETTISNAKVYRLPFALQITDRITASSFWETLKITGISAVTHQAVFEDQLFYYCPDFAKNAINPAQGVDYTLTEPGGDGMPVYVRSPRQLNGLSRSTYYWNTKNGGAERVQFIQETDLEYDEYTKSYCGVKYDLMNTDSSNDYRNQPIGRPNTDNGATVNNFRNSYDGQGHKIVDYCCQADTYQFVGLFGEVQKCILKNIVMTATEPYQSAYVVSNYKSWYYRAGVGALVGLVYVQNKGEQAVIENCSVSGYRVEFDVDASSSMEYAVGGLAGFCFGQIRNSSAVCQVALSAHNGQSEWGAHGYGGGLVGSLNGEGTIDNCYAGGSISNVSKASIGGICGGFFDIYGYGYGNDSVRAMQIRNSYSYCTLSGLYTKTTLLYGVAPTLKIGYWGWSNLVNNQIRVSDCWYLTDTVDSSLELRDANCGVSYSDLTAKILPEANSAAASGTASADNSHPFPTSTDLVGKAYPFPAVVRAMDGTYVHYGDWPVSNTSQLGDLELTQTAYMVYYEQYADNSIGVYTVDANGYVGNTIRNDSDITNAGYAYLTKSRDIRVCIPSGDSPLTGSGAFGDTIQPNYVNGYDLVALSAQVKEKLPDQWGQAKQIRLTEANGADIQLPYVNSKFAYGIYHKQVASGNTYLIRTAQQLQNANGLAFNFELDHDIVIPDDMSFTSLNSSGVTYDGKGHTITGLKVPLFNSISGTTVKNFILKNVDIVSDTDTAALVLNCTGMVENCAVTGSVKSANGSAAGVILHLTDGWATNSYFDGTVSAASIACGFYLDGRAKANQCYAKAAFAPLGTTTQCYGFGYNGWQESAYYMTSDGLSTSNIGVPCTAIDWDMAVDASGVPNANWPSAIKIEQAAATAAEEPTDETADTSADMASQSADSSAVQSADDAA